MSSQQAQWLLFALVALMLARHAYAFYKGAGTNHLFALLGWLVIAPAGYLLNSNYNAAMTIWILGVVIIVLQHPLARLLPRQQPPQDNPPD